MRKTQLSAIAAAGIFLPQAAPAEVVTDKGWLDIGGFYAGVDSNLRIDNQTLGIPGTNIDLENDLGLDSDRFLPKVSGGIRLTNRFRLEGDFFQLSRKGSLIIDEVLIVDDTVFPIAAEVDTKFRTDIYRIAVGYSLIRNDKAEFGVSAGVHQSRGKFSIEASGLGLALEERRSKSFPLPNVGVYGNALLWGPVSVQGSFDAFKMKAGKYSGSLVDAQLGLEARVMKSVGIGLGYRYAGYTIKARKSDWRGKLDYAYSGPMAYIELAF